MQTAFNVAYHKLRRLRFVYVTNGTIGTLLMFCLFTFNKFIQYCVQRPHRFPLRITLSMLNILTAKKYGQVYPESALPTGIMAPI